MWRIAPPQTSPWGKGGAGLEGGVSGTIDKGNEEDGSVWVASSEGGGTGCWGTKGVGSRDIIKGRYRLGEGGLGVNLAQNVWWPNKGVFGRSIFLTRRTGLFFKKQLGWWPQI